MCGLVGVFGLITPQVLQVFHNLLDVDVIRGRDSTGVAFIDWNGETSIHKAVGMPANIYNTEDYGKAVMKTNIRGIIGHNRAATRGEIIVGNAHPFRHGEVTLAHNGTLWDTIDLLEPYENERFGTDSETICHHLSNNDIAETYSQLNGAAALSWWDRRDSSLNLITNGERPLHIAFNTQTLFWASEAWMLREIIGRNKTIKVREVQSLNDHWHMSVFWRNHQLFHTSTKLTPRPITTYSNTNYGWGNWVDDKKKDQRPASGTTPNVVKWDSVAKKPYLTVHGTRVFLTNVPDAMMNDEVRGHMEKEEMIEIYPSCGWCNTAFTTDSISHSHYHVVVDERFCDGCWTSKEVKEMFVNG